MGGEGGAPREEPELPWEVPSPCPSRCLWIRGVRSLRDCGNRRFGIPPTQHMEMRGAPTITPLLFPQRSDPRLLSQFFFADERVTRVVAEINGLDAELDPQQYLVLLNQLHVSQVRGQPGSRCDSVPPGSRG